MQQHRLNRNLVKLLYRRNEDIENYRFYIIARTHYAYVSGIFKIEDFLDLLHKKYNYKSLHRGPGNRRKLFKEKLYSNLKTSILFNQLLDGRFKINSERKILKKYIGTDKSSYYILPSFDTITVKSQFKNFIIGVLLTGNKFRSNKLIAQYCNVSVRRIQLATANNHKKEIFEKHYNFINYFDGTWKQVEQQRAELFNIHGISSPKPKRNHDGTWTLILNAPNTYTGFVLSGVKGFKAQPTGTEISRNKTRLVSKAKKECFFRPMKSRNPLKNKNKKLKKYSGNKNWLFNENIYNFGDYIVDNSKQMDGEIMH